MALSELAALDAAYRALWPLDPAGRRRSLEWLSDALALDAPLAVHPDAVDPPAASGINGAAPATPAAGARDSPNDTPDDAPRGPRRGRAAGQPRNRATAASSQSAPVASGSTRTRGVRSSRT